MSDYKIEKNVPMPNGTGKGWTKYPWHEMAVGDSFLIEKPTLTKLGFPRVYAGISNVRYAPKKFTQRKQEDGSLRIWRIE